MTKLSARLIIRLVWLALLLPLLCLPAEDVCPGTGQKLRAVPGLFVSEHDWCWVAPAPPTKAEAEKWESSPQDEGWEPIPEPPTKTTPKQGISLDELLPKKVVLYRYFAPAWAIALGDGREIQYVIEVQNTLERSLWSRWRVSGYWLAWGAYLATVAVIGFYVFRVRILAILRAIHAATSE